jgi:hypothetical protein
MRLKVDSDKVLLYSNILKELHKSALPSAVRGTLNKAAYDVKTNTMPAKAKSEFVERDSNFFKANSKFEYAKGFNINSMQSKVGFVDNSLRDKPNPAVKELQQQEEGGTIQNKTFIALPGARIGNNFNKNTRPNARIKKLKKFVNIKNTTGKNWAERAIKSAVFAGKGGLVLTNKVIYRIDSIKRKGKNITFNKTKLYSVQKNRSIKVNATHFMKEASLSTQKKMEMYYIEEALRQLKKFR